MHNRETQIGDIVRRARETKGLTQVALAEQINVSNRTIIAVEMNQRNPTYEVLYRLVHTLDISADLIFFPERAPLQAEQEQFLQEFLSCDEREQQIILTTFRSLIRALRHGKNKAKPKKRAVVEERPVLLCRNTRPSLVVSAF